MSETIATTPMSVPISSSSQLREYLIQSGIPLEKWNIESAKSLEDLFREISRGETTLSTNTSGLVRSTSVVRIDVYYKDDHHVLWRLKEDKQVFRDGRERSRPRKSAIAEKCLRNEDPLAAAARALSEELAIHRPLTLTPEGQHQETRVSRSYPGLLSQYTVYSYRVTLDACDYQEQGYTENGDGGDIKCSSLTTYFVWTRVQE